MLVYMCRIGAVHQRPESYPVQDVSRSHSVKSSAKNHRVFRASDLAVGEVLGRGFYGQAVKVSVTRRRNAHSLEIRYNTLYRA